MEKNIVRAFLFLLGVFNTPALLLTSCDQTSNSTPVHLPSVPLQDVYQCNDHLSSVDCLACFDATVAQTRNCSAGYDVFAALIGDCYERTNLVNPHGDCIPNFLPITTDTDNTKQTMDHHIALGGRKLMREIGDITPSPPAGDFGRGSPNWNSTHNATTQHPERR